MTGERQEPNEPTAATECSPDYTEAVVLCWGWLNRDQQVQATTFRSVTAAIAEMCKRLSYDTDDDSVLDRIYMLGFKLVQVKKTVQVIRVLD